MVKVPEMGTFIDVSATFFLRLIHSHLKQSIFPRPKISFCERIKKIRSVGKFPLLFLRRGGRRPGWFVKAAGRE